MIYIVCGPPASGKSWVCEQLSKSFSYVPHDEYQDTKHYAKELIDAKKSDWPNKILGDCPFAERPLKEALESLGEKAEFYFIVETPEVLSERYKERGKPIPKGHLTRLNSMPARAKEWGAFHGTSEQVLEKLKNITA